jgi:Fe-S cluster biogenesis protein NfuA
MIVQLRRQPMNSPIDNDLKSLVAQTIAVEIRLALQMDGGDIEVLDVNKGVVRVRFHGTCSGCPGTIMALVMELEQELRKRLPEVEYLEAVP